MGVLKFGTLRYDGGGVDIQNTLNIPIPIKEPEEPEVIEEELAEAEPEVEETEPEPRFSVEEILAQRDTSQGA